MKQYNDGLHVDPLLNRARPLPMSQREFFELVKDHAALPRHHEEFASKYRIFDNETHADHIAKLAAADRKIKKAFNSVVPRGWRQFNITSLVGYPNGANASILQAESFPWGTLVFYPELVDKMEPREVCGAIKRSLAV